MIDPWIAVLTTTERPQYLRDTLTAIDAAGGAAWGGRRVIFVDGPPAVPAPRWPGWATINVSGGGQPRGTRRALWRVLHLAAVAQVPELLYFEDDIRLTLHAIPTMSAIRVPPGLAFLTFCNQQAGLPDTPPAPPAIYERPGDPARRDYPAHWGNQALKIPDRSLRLFRFPSTEPIGEYAFASDVWLGEKLGPYGIVLPSIVRHVGAETAIPCQVGMSLDGHRGGLNYAGDEYDARALIAQMGRRTRT